MGTQPGQEGWGRLPALPIGCMQVWVSLEKLNSGGTKRVGLERQRVDANGIVIQQSKTFYLVIRCRGRVLVPTLKGVSVQG